MSEITVEQVGEIALQYCRAAHRIKFAHSPEAKAVELFTEEQLLKYDIDVSVVERELFAICSAYEKQLQEKRNEYYRSYKSEEAARRGDHPDVRP